MIDTSSFYKNSLSSVKIPASVKKINMYAFHKNNIAEVEVPAGAQLHVYAFEANTEIKK